MNASNPSSHLEAPPIFAIVLNYRQPLLTVRTVQTLQRSTLLERDFRVILVDNGSVQVEYELMRRRLPDVQIVPSPENRGFAGGNNLALEIALCEARDAAYSPADTYVLLLNNDVKVEPDALQLCVEYLNQHRDVGIVGPRVLLPDGRLDLACRRSFPTPSSAIWKLTGLARRYPDNPRFARYNLTHLDEHQTADVDSVMGAFMLVRLAAIHHAGTLDEAFFMYGEDLDWAYRIKAHGWRVVYYPAARVWHLKGATTRRRSRQMIIEFYRAMWLFYRKHQSRRRQFLLNWLVMMGIIVRGAVALCQNALRPAGRKRVA